VWECYPCGTLITICGTKVLKDHLDKVLSIPEANYYNFWMCKWVVYMSIYDHRNFCHVWKGVSPGQGRILDRTKPFLFSMFLFELQLFGNIFMEIPFQFWISWKCALKNIFLYFVIQNPKIAYFQAYFICSLKLE
jgi:hypothetical protein